MSSLFGTDVFKKAFEQFDEQTFFETLHERVKNKSYFEKYKGFKITLTWLSYLFNLASALTASYAVYWLSQKLTGLHYPSMIVAALALFFLEKIKRKSSTEFWQILFFNRHVATGWLALSLFCLGLSLASSSFGVKEGTEDMGPGAELIATDSTAQDYRQRIAKLEADNLKLEQQRNAQGEIYWPAQQEKEKNKAMIADLQTRILALDQKLEGHNEQLSAAYKDDLNFTAWSLVYITIAMEILFELCIAWIWFYHYRSYVERKQLGLLSLPEENAQTSPLPSSAPDEETLKTYLKSILQDLQHGEPPAPSPNGHATPHNSVQTHRPIGFFKRPQNCPEKPSSSSPLSTPDPDSVHMCTDVYRAERIESDLYTVIHEYTKGGQTFRTPYTRNQILSRIGQYERGLLEARDKGLTQVTIKNREQWLKYWQGKLEELQRKKQTLWKNR